MEESSGAHSGGDEILPEKNKKRKLKTPAQIEALEKFYDEHKYPTESMKLQLAEKIGLTEKQISGWFCHRRLKDKKLLKDEACANGRLDRSSGVIQDHGSGPGQDSCGSTKPGDYKHVDSKEVESQRLYGQAFPAADVTCEKRSFYAGNCSGTDDTSSESSLALEDRFYPQSKDPRGMETSRYLTQDGAIMLTNAKGIKNRESMRPSGYLKVKGNIEHAAITAVKRQLGRHYREDGPPLGVEFQPLPPGAFETPLTDAVHEPYYASDPILSHSPEISGVRKQGSLSTRYDLSHPRFGSPDSYMGSQNFRTIHGSDSQDNYSHHQLIQHSSLPSYRKPYPGRRSSLDMNEVSVGEVSAYDGKRSHAMRSTHGAEGLRLEPLSDSLNLYNVKITGIQADSYLRNYDDDDDDDDDDDNDDDDVDPKIIPRREHLKFNHSNSNLRQSESVGVEEIRPSRRISKDKGPYIGKCLKKEYQDPVGVNMHPTNEMTDKTPYLEKSVKKEYQDPIRVKTHPTNEMILSKRVKEEHLQRDYMTKESFAENSPWTNRIKGSGMEMPSGFSEDETAETDYSDRGTDSQE